MAKSYKLKGTGNYVDATGVAYNKKELPYYLDQIGGLPIGTIIPYASGDNIPAGFLKCDGSYVLKEDYPELYNIIGDTYENPVLVTPEGSFWLPDLSGRVPVGNTSVAKDSELASIGSIGGEKKHKLTNEEMPIHTHRLYCTANPGNGGPAHMKTYSEQSADGMPMYDTGGNVGNSGLDQPHNNMQPYLVVCYIIKAKLVSNPEAEVKIDTMAGMPIGTVIPYASNKNIPTGFMICDGAEVSRTTYSKLYSIIEDRYGYGDGSTTFNLPDLSGRVVVGVDKNDLDLHEHGIASGEKEHTLTVDELASHAHSANNFVYNPDRTPKHAIAVGSGSSQIAYDKDGDTFLEINMAGNSQPHNNMQPFMTMYYIIKVTTTSPIVDSTVIGQVIDSLSSTSATDALSAKSGKDLNDKINGTILYENASGNTGTVTLQESINNYTYIDIVLTRKDIVDYSIQRFHKPNGKTITIMGTFTDAANLYVYSKIMAVLNNTLTLVRSNLLLTNSAVSFSTDNNFAIVKVVGYK